MQLEIKLKYYNSSLQIGLDDWRQVYDVANGVWLQAKEHRGRLVYGNRRIPYLRIKAGIDKQNFIIQEYIPF